MIATVSRARSLGAIVVAMGLAACAGSEGMSCPPGMQPMASESLYFGTATPTGKVSAEAWSRFLAEAVTTRFPAGLSVWPAAGQWRSADGSLIRESSFVLNLVHADDRPTDEAIRALIAEYKARFGQEAVMRVKTHGCVSF